MIRIFYIFSNNVLCICMEFSCCKSCFAANQDLIYQVIRCEVIRGGWELLLKVARTCCSLPKLERKSIQVCEVHQEYLHVFKAILVILVDIVTLYCICILWFYDKLILYIKNHISTKNVNTSEILCQMFTSNFRN